MSSDDKLSLDAFRSNEQLPQESLPEITANRIRSMIRDGTLPSGTQLPNELELAEAMRVSRGTIRSALALLQQQGLIWRRQGVGSFVSENPILENRLDINAGVTELIESMGLKPGIRDMKIKLIPADEHLSSQLAVPLGSQLVSVHRIRTANDQPVVASLDYFSSAVLERKSGSFHLDQLKETLERKNSLYRVLEEELSITIDYGIARLRPVKADAGTLKMIGLDVPSGSVMLFVEQVDFDHDRQPVILSQEYHVVDFCNFTIYRRG